MKTYKINYKNGNQLTMQAYAVEHADGKYYVCGKSYACDNPEYYILSDKHIESIEEV